MYCRRARGLPMIDLVAVILAGGDGRRIGGGKPNIRLDGRRLIDRAIDHVAEWRIPARLSVREPGQVYPARLPEVVDDPRIEGPLGGLLGALAWAVAFGARRVITVPCDMPYLPCDLKTRLDAMAVQFDQPAVATSLQRRHPVCSVWPVRCLGPLQTYADSGRRSLNGALERCAAVSVDWSVQDGRDPFYNINTSGDLARVSRSINTRLSGSEGVAS